MKVNFSAMISQLNRAKQTESDDLLVIPPHGPVMSSSEIQIALDGCLLTSAEWLNNVAESL